MFTSRQGAHTRVVEELCPSNHFNKRGWYDVSSTVSQPHLLQHKRERAALPGLRIWNPDISLGMLALG